ncbi:MAG TPA: hypothetical protein PLY85_06935 [Anaerolineaceae bacterium]|nr:hypothetical protein [Anaerolineaceae bacterium]
MRKISSKILPAMLIGGVSGWAFYYLLYQIPGVISIRRFGYAIVTGILVTALLYYFWPKISKLLENLDTTRKTTILVIGSLMAGLAIVLCLIYPGILVENLLVPTNSIKITVVGNGAIEVSWLNNGFQDISLSELKVFNGKISVTESGKLFSPDESGQMEILWNGRAINNISIVVNSPEAVPFFVSLNDQRIGEANVSSGSSTLSASIPIRTPFIAVIIPFIVIGIFAFLFFIILMLTFLPIDSNCKDGDLLKNEPINNLILLVVILVSLIAIGLLTNTGINNRYLYDDYCYAASGKDLGFLECTTLRLQTTNGRFSQMSLLCLMDTINPLGFRLSVGICQILLFLSLFLAIRSLFPSGLRSLIAGAASLIYLLVLVSVPYIAHTLIWYSGMVTVVPSLIGFNILIFLCFRNNKHKSFSFWVPAGVFIIAFINAGFNETIDSMLIGLTFLLIIASFIPGMPFPNTIRYKLIVAFVGTLGGFILMASLPGTGARLTRYVQPDLGIGILKTVFESGLETLRLAFGSVTGMVAFSLIPIAGISIGTELKFSEISHVNKRSISFGLFVLAWIVYLGGFVPAAYALNANMPQRTMIVPLYILIFLLFVSMIFAGSLIRTHIKGIPWVTLLLATLYLASLFFARYNPVGRIYAQYATGFDRRELIIMQAKADGLPIIEVGPILSPELLFGDIKSSSDYWVNKCATNYYDIDVRLQP